MSLREIAGYLHVSHNTVKKAIESTDIPEYKRPGRINHNLEPFKEVIFDLYAFKKYSI